MTTITLRKSMLATRRGMRRLYAEAEDGQRWETRFNIQGDFVFSDRSYQRAVARLARRISRDLGKEGEAWEFAK